MARAEAHGADADRACAAAPAHDQAGVREGAAALGRVERQRQAEPGRLPPTGDGHQRRLRGREPNDRPAPVERRRRGRSTTRRRRRCEQRRPGQAVEPLRVGGRREHQADGVPRRAWRAARQLRPKSSDTSTRWRSFSWIVDRHDPLRRRRDGLRSARPAPDRRARAATSRAAVLGRPERRSPAAQQARRCESVHDERRSARRRRSGGTWRRRRPSGRRRRARPRRPARGSVGAGTTSRTSPASTRRHAPPVSRQRPSGRACRRPAAELEASRRARRRSRASRGPGLAIPTVALDDGERPSASAAGRWQAPIRSRSRARRPLNVAPPSVERRSCVDLRGEHTAPVRPDRDRGRLGRPATAIRGPSRSGRNVAARVVAAPEAGHRRPRRSKMPGW